MQAYHVIGTAAPRVDGVAKTTGAARYAADTDLPGVLWMKALRSPYPHARIVSIDTSRAQRLPGVHAVLTGDEVTGVLYGRRMRDVPVLAHERVRFAGERVAAVAATDAETAQRAVDLIDVVYEELPAVLEPEEALAAGAPLLHPDVQAYHGLPAPLPQPTNAFVSDVWGRGNPERGFAEADIVVEGVYTTQRAHQAYLEPHSCVVWIDDDGRLQIWAPNKAPHRLKLNLADALGLDPKRIVVRHSTIGGDFGGKGSPMDIPVCYFLAQKTGRPVKSVMTFAEEFSAANPRHPSVVRMRTGVKRDGTLTAHEAQFLFNSGAYGGFKPVPGVNLPGASHAAGPYRIPHTRIEAVHLYTNTIPGGFFRGPGAVQANFAIESHMDVIAQRLGLEPLELRRKNLVRGGEELANGMPGLMMRPEETVDAAVRASGYNDPKPPHVGRGISLSYKDQGEGVSSAAVTFRPDGTVLLHTSVFEQGTGSYTALVQIVGEALGVAPGLIEVQAWDSDDGPFDTGVGASRVTRVAGPAAYDAATRARDELFRLTTRLLRWPAERIALSGSDVRRTDTGESVPWAELVAQADASVTGSATNNAHEHSPVASAMAQVAEVRVDPETGRVELLKLTSAHDVGVVINPIGHQGQINGGVVQGIGHALTEELMLEDGRVVNPTLADYKLPSIADLPELRTALVESEEGVGPYRTKGIGEYAIEGISAAVANAVADAVGVRIADAPVTAEKVYRALRDRGHYSER